MIECASSALTVKLNWGSGEEQSDASTRRREEEEEDDEEEEEGEELNTPRSFADDAE